MPPSRRHAIPAILVSFACITQGVAAETPCPPPGSIGTPAAATAPTAAATSEAAPAPGSFDVDSNEAVLGVDGNATLTGDVRVREGDREIRADAVEYDAKKNSFDVQGHVEYTDPQLRVSGEGGTYSPTGGASFKGAQFELPARPARGAADVMRLDPDGVIRLDGVTYTTCPADSPDWRIRARNIALDTREREGTGRNASVEFKGVPIVYLPWMSFPLGTQRKSGFLFPNVGHSSRGGIEASAPYYWNIAPNYDFSADPVIYGRRGVDLAGEFRYLTSASRGSFAFNYLPDDSLAQIDRSRVRLAHRTDFASGWRIDLRGENVSDSRYFEDFAQGPEGTSIAFLERALTASYRDEHLRLFGEVQHFQTIDRTLADADRPFARLPRLVASGDWSYGRSGRLTYGFDSEVVNFDRGFGVDGWRLDAAPRVGFDLSGPGYFLRPSASWRTTSYRLDGLAPGAARSPSRTLPTATLDTGLVFERPAGSRGQRRMTLEPRLLYTYTPFREQSTLPIFDTALPDFNLVQLFRTNRYVGADRVSDANQVAVGVTSRLRSSADGRQYLSATLGQVYYFDSPRVALPGESLAGRGTSDVVAQLGLTAYKNWNVDLGLQWNPSATRSERSQIRLQYRPAPDKVVNLAYRYQRDRIDQAEVSTAWPINPRWRLFARGVYSVADSNMIERFAGFEYEACCWRIRLVGRRFVSDRSGAQDSAVLVQLELKGLASVGTPADTFLGTAIRGYSPPP